MRTITLQSLFLVLITIFLSFIQISVSAQTYERTFTIKFEKEGFVLEQMDGLDYIFPDVSQYAWGYGEDTSKPALPFISYKFLLPDGYKMKEFTFSTDMVLFAENVTLSTNLIEVPISNEAENVLSYAPLTYSAEVIYNSEHIMDGYRLVDFSINPFTYNAESGKLDLCNSLNLSIVIEVVDKDENIEHSGTMLEHIKSLVYNPDDFDFGVENWHTYLSMFEEDTIYPVDKTYLIQNPDYSNNDNVGWEGTMPAFMDSNNAEHYQKTFNTYQDLENLPNGVYAVSLSGFYRYGFETEANVEEMMYAKLYAKSGTDSLNADFRSILVGARETPLGFSFERQLPNGLYIPYHMSSASVYLKDPAYRTTLFFDVEDGKARIGVKKDTLLGYDWAIWQDWSLAYYGNDADAYRVWLDTVLAEAPRFDGQTLTVGMLESYNSMLSSFTPDKASILSAIKLIAEESAKLKANSEAWQIYEEDVECMNMVLEDPYIPRGKEYFELVKYSEKVPDIIGSRTLTTEEIIAEAIKLEDLWASCIIVHVVDDTPNRNVDYILQSSGQTLHCSSSEASSLEVYTLDGMKVGESIFQNSEAVVEVNKVPATYLYVISYPDGRRTSGKVVVK